MKPPAKQGRNRKFDNMECPRIGLAFRTRPTAPPHACAWGPRRDHVAKRPDSGRTTARANVEGRHLLSGFAGPVQRRSAHDPRRRIQGTKGGEPSFAVCAKSWGWILLDF